MRSRATFRSHPLHPMLVSFPIAFTVGALVADVAGRLGTWPTVWSAGAYLSVGALVTGLLAGVPGLVDYFSIVPPNSSAKERATWHMVVNLVALSLFGAGWGFRDGTTLEPGTGTVVLEAIGITFISAGGWLGGTLVFRNQIGVDHRYAHAGKWSEVTADGVPGEAVEVAKSDELKAGQMKLVVANGRRVLLLRTDDGYAACDDRCTHKGGSLAGGVSACGQVVCPWHGSTFDAKTGRVIAGPADEPVATHPVTEQNGSVLLTLPARS